MDRKLQNNLSKIYLMVFCRSTMLIAAVFVPLLESHGLSMTEIMQTQALFALTIAFFEVPSGYLADIWGRKNTLVCGAAMSALGFGLLVQANEFTDFLLYEFLLGIGTSLCSGTDLAILYDTQNHLNRIKQQQGINQAIAKLFSLDGIAGATGAVVAGGLTFWSLQYVVIVQSLVGLLPLLCAITLIEPPRKILLSSHRNNFSLIKANVMHEPLVLITAAAMIIFGLTAIYIFWLYQKYWESQGVPLACFGYLWAIHCAIRGCAAHYAHRIEALLGPRKALTLIAGLSIFGIVVMASKSGWIGICVAFVLPISRGISCVIFADALNQRINAEFRATLNSLVSLGFRALFIITAPILGLLIDYYSVTTVLYILAVVFTPAYIIILAVLFALLGKARKENSNEFSALKN